MGMLNNLPLEVLATNIEDSPNNWTRFFILQLAPQEQPHQPVQAGSSRNNAGGSAQSTCPTGNKSTLAFSVADTPGSLAHVLTVFAKAKANLSKLESRPSRTGTWRYVFFADLNCNVNAPEFEPMLEELANYCHGIRILGVYTAFS